MGMDVYGRKPTAPEGEYFRRNVWGWRPLADMVTTLFPELTDKCRYWQSNDGDGLDARGSQRLADAIDKALADGTIHSWVTIRDAEIKAGASNYGVDADDAKEFAAFLRASGGFEIC